MANFNIKIVSDAICPWCYVGKKRLERAIETYKRDIPGGANDSFTISWHPFYLDPTLPKVGVDRDVHLAKKFGPERAAMATAHLKALGEAEGIKFSLKGKIGNTRDAHRLVQLAKTKSSETEDRVISTLFKSHFEEDSDITSQNVLVAVGEKAGLDKAEVQDWLSQGKGGEEVDREVEDAYRKGIHGVPNFTINGRYELQGAQDPQKFLEVFAQAKKSFPAVSTSSSEGISC
ncbi:DSBA-like thioredoxin domain-containing protein [Corynascus novoguineensis]|uniref:DSBA-like thioredoxin domain-containing protein n=1 Tax=Corynascus novoguineensis TaxID=1126955 RepID=A0AAN7CZ97_9PEZI|nr:DSBA-like thioredoxin domain-containing protein [Corynascus novoguineensis]